MTTSALKNGRRQNIDRTRGQLGDTMEELTHKIHVPARVRDKVNDAKQTVRVKTDEGKQQAQTNAEEVKQQAQIHIEEVKQQAQANTDDVKQQAQANTDDVKQQAQANTEEVKQQAQANTEEVKQQAQTNTEEVKQQIPESSEALHLQPMGVARQAERLTPQALEKLPSPVAACLESLMTTARQRQLPAAAVALGVLVVLLLVLRRMFCRST